jgi:hypothetical protein
MDKRAHVEDPVRELAGFLREHGEEWWADALDQDADLIASGDDTGVAHLLKRFGGMGSLNDLILKPSEVDDRYVALRERAWQEAARAHKTDGP